eukprot:scaffold3316_cov390-Prasinococcus_capsulatus_cf.AAC.2
MLASSQCRTRGAALAAVATKNLRRARVCPHGRRCTVRANLSHGEGRVETTWLDGKPSVAAGRLSESLGRVEKEHKWEEVDLSSSFVRPWERVDIEERLICALEGQMREAVAGEDYREAARLRDALNECMESNEVAKIMLEYKQAVAEERYADAARLRDVGVGMVGWWCAHETADGTRIPGGHILQVVPAHGRFLGVSYTARQLVNGAPGTPEFEVFPSVDENGEYQIECFLLRKERHGETDESHRLSPLAAGDVHIMDEEMSLGQYWQLAQSSVHEIDDEDDSENTAFEVSHTRAEVISLSRDVMVLRANETLDEKSIYSEHEQLQRQYENNLAAAQEAAQNAMSARTGIAQKEAMQRALEHLSAAAMGRDRLGTCLPSSTRLVRMNSEPTRGLEGLFWGSFGPHGPELVQLKQMPASEAFADAPDLMGDDPSEPCVVAYKVTGDPNVPAGEASFRARVGRNSRLEAHGEYPEEIGIQRRFAGQGRVAQLGFTKAHWVQGELLEFSKSASVSLEANSIIENADLGFVWSVPGELPFLVLFTRVQLSEHKQ